jgi:hypothetical protein
MDFAYFGDIDKWCSEEHFTHAYMPGTLTSEPSFMLGSSVRAHEKA